MDGGHGGFGRVGGRHALDGEAEDGAGLLVGLRLRARLGIAEYDVPAPMAEKPLTTSCVRIALRMGVGAPSVPVVAVGDKVRKNQLVADIAEKKLGVKMHASISGVVTDITADYIEIRKAAK